MKCFSKLHILSAANLFGVKTNKAIEFMKPLLNRLNAFLALTLLLWSCSNTVQENSLKSHKLKGKVKSVKQYSYDSLQSITEQAALVVPVIVKSYNPEGNIVSYTVFNADGSVNSDIVTNYYDGYSVDSMYFKNDLISQSTQEYNSKGLITKSAGNGIIDNSPGRQNGTDYKYDKNSNLIEVVEYNKNRKLLSRVTYKYNSSDQKIETREYNSLNKLEGHEVYEYDKQANKIKSSYYNSLGVLDHVNTYGYNEKGDEIEASSHTISRNHRSNGKSLYEYDSNENWTKKISGSGSNILITVREITYF